MTQSNEQALLGRVVAHCRKREWFAGQYAPDYRVAFYDADGRDHLDDDMTYAAAHAAQQGFLHAPVTEGVLQETERRLGHTLPTILRTVYTTVANGGFGPGYGLVGLPMLANTLTVGQERLVPRAEEYLTQHPQSCVYCQQEPSDLVTLAAWPEDVYSKLDIARGCVYRVRHGVFPPEPTWAAAITVTRQAESVVDWFERWLAGELVAYDDDEDSRRDESGQYA
jgi:hypothetical protein